MSVAAVERPIVPFVDLPRQYASIEHELQQALRLVFARGDFVLGSALEQFETAFASYCGSKHAVGVANGGDAIELALRAFGIGPGDEVITAANTFIATVLAIMATGARPILADIDPETYTIDPEALSAAISPRTRALIPVHLYGQPADLTAVQTIATRHQLIVIEDAAQAHGARFNGARVGSFGQAGTFSFYPSKNLGAYGDGGMIVTNDDRVAERLRLLRNYGQERKYVHTISGRNSRLDSLQAATLNVKLPHLDEWNRARRRHAAAYGERLIGVHVPVSRDVSEHVYHLYVIELDRRDAVRQTLKSRGIHTGIHYPVPTHLQTACTSLGYRRGQFPLTEAAAGRILSLPMYPELTDAQIDYVAAAITG